MHNKNIELNWIEMYVKRKKEDEQNWPLLPTHAKQNRVYIYKKNKKEIIEINVCALRFSNYFTYINIIWTLCSTFACSFLNMPVVEIDVRHTHNIFKSAHTWNQQRQQFASFSFSVHSFLCFNFKLTKKAYCCYAKMLETKIQTAIQWK